MKKIKIQQIGKFFEEEHEALIRFAVFTLDSRIKQVSPVDTGRFRMNWQLAENKRSAPIQGGPFNPNKSAIIPPFKLNYLKEKVGNTYSLINPLPYAEAVCFGTNTPPSWNNTFQSRDSNRSAGWPLKEVEFVARKVRKAQSKN
jgi:hypothetical protein|tara:strand:- start:1571 stop:2002 length:432 start_codon:yes stop_codon:yes gene_type:complete